MKRYFTGLVVVGMFLFGAMTFGSMGNADAAMILDWDIAVMPSPNKVDLDSQNPNKMWPWKITENGIEKITGWEFTENGSRAYLDVMLALQYVPEHIGDHQDGKSVDIYLGLITENRAFIPAEVHGTTIYEKVAIHCKTILLFTPDPLKFPSTFSHNTYRSYTQKVSDPYNCRPGPFYGTNCDRAALVDESGNPIYEETPSFVKDLGNPAPLPLATNIFLYPGISTFNLPSSSYGWLKIGTIELTVGDFPPAASTNYECLGNGTYTIGMLIVDQEDAAWSSAVIKTSNIELH